VIGGGARYEFDAELWRWWTTSVFPEGRDGGAYVLPVKKAVRTAEGVGLGDVVRLAVETLD